MVQKLQRVYMNAIHALIIRGIKRFVKCVFLVAGVLAVSPLIAMNWIEYWLFTGKTECFYSFSKELLSVVPTFAGDFLRLGYYWLCCTKVSYSARFMLGSVVSHRKVAIGSGTILGSYSTVGYVEIGDNVLIGAHAAVLSGKYQHGRPCERQDGNSGAAHFQTIHIGRNSWIGNYAIIMADVGINCTVGAGSVVCKKVEDNTTVLGNPARKVSY